MDACSPSDLLLSLSAPPPPPPKKKWTKRTTRSRIVFDFPAETLAQYMHMRQDQAAKLLGVATITLKRICHRHKVKWMYREYKANVKRMQKKNAESSTQPIPLAKPRPPVVSKVVPPLMPRSMRVQYSSERIKLPSLEETLGSPVGSFKSVPFPAKQRPHLSLLIDQPLVEPAPMLPRLNVPQTTSILHTPTYTMVTPTKESSQVLSPSMARFNSLPSTGHGWKLSRTIG